MTLSLASSADANSRRHRRRRGGGGPCVAQLAAAELGWTEAEQAQQMDSLAWISRERQGLTADVIVEQ